MASVELVGLKKAFGKVEVIHGLDISVSDGEFVALVGPSGCGKSTMLRIIAGLEEASEGEIRFDGEVMNQLNPRARNIAMVFQSYALYPHMTVAQNIGFNLRLSGLPKREIRQRVEDAARLLELTDLLERRPAQLSGGQRQRVAMGRAIVRDPAVFLFDEPLSNLDAKLRVQMRAEIKKLHQKVKTTSIYVTHDQVEAMTLADKIVVMNKGYVEQVGTPLQLYQDPQNIFVAGFIGSPAMNFLQASMAVIDGRSVGLLEDGSHLAIPSTIDLPAGTQVVLGLRPEHMRPGHSDTSAAGEVVLVEPTGAQTHVTFRLAGQDLISVVEGSYTAMPGDRFEVRIDPAEVFLFDRDSGQRIRQ
jgi:multiple sugar transport system ATP-binding protein